MGEQKRKVISILAAFFLVINAVFGCRAPVFAATFPVQLFVESCHSGELTLYWNSLPGTQSVEVTYHYPGAGGVPVEEHFISNQEESSIQIGSLQNDITYDIDIKIYDAPDAGGNEVGHGFIYFMPQITFYAQRIEQQRHPMDSGGFETGIDPGMKLRWVMPKVFDGSEFVYMDEALHHMETTINDVYEEGRQLDSMNFRINISTDSSKLNGGSSQAAVIIERGTPEYTAHISGNPGITSKVHEPDADGFMEFDLIGRKDTGSDPPAPADDYQLRDWDILPGTVYYMNIKPVFRDSQGGLQNGITVGPQSWLNGSRLSGSFNYTYTPVRFQLTRDGLNNVYVKIYKINEGSLDLPRMYYQVQTTDDPSIPGDWTVRKTLDDTYFGGEYAITVISGISPDNEVFYKIVVKTDAQPDRIESPVMPYTLSEDLVRPPVPAGVMVTGRELATGQVVHPVSEEELTVKSTDIELSWQKPLGWDSIKDDLYFHILLNMSQESSGEQSDIYLDGSLWGSYPLEYRLVKYISAQSPSITDNGESLSLVLGGFDLFTWEDSGGNSYEIQNDEDYPDFLMPNTVYYLQMYTTNEENRGSTDPEFMSDRSLTISLTTLRQEEREVPLPGDFSIYRNDTDGSGRNLVQMQFSGLREHALDWSRYTSEPHEDDSIYYDVYMSTRTELDSFIMIGSTGQESDVSFNIENTETGIYITASISTFTQGSDAYNAFGECLRPNSTYYFMVRTRLSMVNEPQDKESQPTALLPVTTVRLEIQPPDESAKKPLAPVDFSVAGDAEGNPIVSGSGAAFDWTHTEQQASYRIICTSERVQPYTVPEEYQNDPLYVSFIDDYGYRDSDGDDSVFTLDPGQDLEDGFLEYDAETGMLRFFVVDWLYPNRLYYFSIRAVDADGESVWVSVPVTTIPVEMPSMLQPVTDVQAGFNWSDPDPGSRVEDYNVYLRGPGQEIYAILERSRYTIVKEGSVYYCRIFGLEAGSSYDIRVFKGEETQQPFFESLNFVTRDSCHQVHVRWTGKDNYTYQAALKEEYSSSYTLLEDTDIELYTEKTPATAGTDYFVYHAIIKTALVEMPHGPSERLPLASNTAYNVKVRTRLEDPLDPGVVSCSKYTPAIKVRTEFSQQDYDGEDRETRKKAAFLDRISEIEEDYYWRMDINNARICSILLKNERLLNIIQEGNGKPFTLDLESIASGFDTYAIYIPLQVIEKADALSCCLVFTSGGMNFYLRPGWLGEKTFTDGAEGGYCTVVISNNDTTGFYSSDPASPVSGLWNVDIEVTGLTKTPSDFEQVIHDRMYDEETGLVNEKLNEFLQTYTGSLESPAFMEYIEGLFSLIKSELSVFIGDTFNSMRMSEYGKSITRFDVPSRFEILSGGILQTPVPYARFDGENTWQRLSGIYDDARGALCFDVTGTGSYLAAIMEQTSGIDSADPYSAYAQRLMQKYDLTLVFDGFDVAARLERDVKLSEIVMLYAMVSETDTVNPYSGISIKIREMGLENYLGGGSGEQSVTRQETAGVLFSLYAAGTGMDKESWQPSVLVWIEDDDELNSVYYKPVLFAVETGIMTTADGGYFRPRRNISRGELCEAVLKLVEMTGG